MSEDPELEAFLRQFRPRPPAPLGRPRARRVHTRVVLWASAAAVTMALVGLLWNRTPPRPPASVATAPLRPTLGALNAALRAGRYEAALDAMDARLLPDPARPGGALRALADVGSDLK